MKSHKILRNFYSSLVFTVPIKQRRFSWL